MEAKFDKVNEVSLDDVEDAHPCYNIVKAELKTLTKAVHFPLFPTSLIKSDKD